MGFGSGVAVHQFVEGYHFVGHLGLAQHEIDDILFQHQRLDLGQAVAIAEVVLDDLLRVFVGLGEIIDIGL